MSRRKISSAQPPRFKKELPLILNVPNFSGVRFHGGNTEQDTEELDKRRVQQWACGARPVPDWLLPELKKLAAKKLDELEKLNIVFG